MAHKPKSVNPFSLTLFPIKNGVRESTIQVRSWLSLEITGKILKALPDSRNPRVSSHLFPINKGLMQLSEVGILMSGLKPKDSSQKMEIWDAEELARILKGSVKPRTQNSAVMAYLEALPAGSHVVLRWQY